MASQDPAIEPLPSLAALTTLGVGGPAAGLARCSDAEDVGRALAWADARGLPTFILGGGSNLLVADRGFDGLVIQLEDRTLDIDADSGRVRAGAGLKWDQLVARTVAEGLAGLECLSGIPGRVGAAPLQNIGAYGRELAENLVHLRALDLISGEVREIPAAECGFGYRWSHFKGPWRDRWLILEIVLQLQPGGAGTVAYGELRQRFPEAPAPGKPGRPPSVAEVRQAVLELRRSKSMVLTAEDPNRRSAGSFFLNPVVSAATALEVERRVERLHGAAVAAAMPRYPVSRETPGREQIKLSAAWLIEQAGFAKGYRLGQAGLSSRHTLAIINRGQARAVDLLRLAQNIRVRVFEAFGVLLEPEPVFLGFEGDVDAVLADSSLADTASADTASAATGPGQG